MKALVLSGGGSRGAYQAGAWEAIHETGWRPDLIYGTSVGAVNGAMIVMADPPDIREWWLGLKQQNVTKTRSSVWKAHRWRSFLDSSPLRALFEDNLDAEAIRKDNRLHVTTTDVEAGRERLWGPQDINIDLLMATTALLPSLSPVILDGAHHGDGGHWSALPLRHALEGGATDVQVLLHDPLEPHREAVPTSIRGMLRRQSDIIWHGRQFAEWRWLQARMRLPKRDPDRIRPADVRFYAPDPPLQNELLKFNVKEAARLYDRGLAETRQALAANPIT